jgi:serine/threonine protein kinase
MTPTPGTRLGPYEILSALGAGGMGEVYRARDTRLKRDVALKILPASFAADPERLARFQREAEVLATLNHPNIAAIYGLEQSNGIRALVMELVEGETLADRIARGPIPIDEALPIARQIAEALEAAHEQGIIHRDLKPANIKVRPDGAVKVLDFGLAKLAEPTASTAPSTLSLSPTITSPAMMTGIGVLLGTAAYMSPEQARGKTVDKRVDIWALGCVLYEMLTGKSAFPGEDITDTLANVLKREPEWSALPPDTPATIHTLLRRCLEKNSRHRIGDVSVVQFVLAEHAALTATTGPRDHTDNLTDVRSDRRRTPWVPWAVAGVLGLALLATSVILVRLVRETAPASDSLQFTISTPDNTQFGGPPGAGTGTTAQLAVSADGRQVAFVAQAQSSSTFSLWVRSMTTLAARQMPGTDDASFPFWSPDGRFIGFFAGGKLKKVQVSGGPPVVLCDAPNARGGTWNGDNVIVFATLGAPLQRVSGAGGAPVAVTTLDRAHGETSHRWPHFLPDGRHVLFIAATGAPGSTQPTLLKIGALDSSELATLFPLDSKMEYASGHVLFVRDGTLMAQSFDPTSRQWAGDAFPVAEEVGNEGSRYSSFSVSSTGVLVYAHGLAYSAKRLTWLDRSGRTIGQVGAVTSISDVALSPDERHAAVASTTGVPRNLDVWTVDLDRGVMSRLTFDPAQEGNPIWSPDSSRLIFQSSNALRQKAAAGVAGDEVVWKPDDQSLLGPTPSDWSPDGRSVAFSRSTLGSRGTDIWILPLAGDRKPFPFVQDPGTDDHASFSPDGRWLAYAGGSGSGETQVLVRAFPGAGGQFQVSKDGGYQPLWRGDGKELFFLAPDGTMMSAAIDTSKQFDAGLPQPLFKSAVRIDGRQYAVTKDGKRFLALVPDRDAAAEPLTVVVNWPSSIQK